MSDLKELYENSGNGLLDSFTSLAAHDLNNMIGTIRTAVELLEMIEEKEIPSAGKYLEIINKATVRLEQLSTRLHKAGKREDRDREEADQDPVILLRNLLTLEEKSENCRINFHNQLDEPSSLKIRTDRISLENLIHWIFKSMGNPETVAVAPVNLSETDCRKSLFDLEPGVYVEIRFLKNREGNPPDPGKFFLPWGEYPELYAARRSVGRMGGEIGAAADKATLTITLHLPASDRSALL